MVSALRDNNIEARVSNPLRDVVHIPLIDAAIGAGVKRCLFSDLISMEMSVERRRRC